MAAEFTFSGAGSLEISGDGEGTCTGTGQLYDDTALKPLILGGGFASGVQDESTYEYCTRKAVWTYDAADDEYTLDTSNTSYWMFRRYTTSAYADDIIAYVTGLNGWYHINMKSASDDIETVANGYKSGYDFSPDVLTTDTETYSGALRPPAASLGGSPVASFYYTPITDYTYNTATVTGQGTEYARSVSPPGGNNNFLGTYKAVGVCATAFSGNSSPYETTMNFYPQGSGDDRYYVLFERQANGLYYYLRATSLLYGFMCTDVRITPFTTPVIAQFSGNASSFSAVTQADGRYYPTESGGNVTLSNE